MGLDLFAEDIAALETRSEGWITDLQLAGFSMQGSKDATGFINSFSGIHRPCLQCPGYPRLTYDLEVNDGHGRV